MLFGLLASVFVIRNLGVEFYADYVLLQALIGTIGIVLSLGFIQTITKLWIEYDDAISRDSILFITIIIQLIIIFFITIGVIIYPKLLEIIFGEDFINLFEFWQISLIFISIIISVLCSSVLIAELDNRYTLISSFINAILAPSWLLFVSWNQIYSTQEILSLIIIINFIASLVLLNGSIKYIKNINLVYSIGLQNSLLKKYLKHFLSTSFVRFFVYFSTLPFIAIVLNKFDLKEELVYIAIFLKIISSITIIIGIPVGKVTGVLFSNAFKNKDQKLMNIIYQSVVKYYLFIFLFFFIGLYHSSEYIINFIYQMKIDNDFLTLLFITILSSILGVANWMIQINEHYKLTYYSSLSAMVLINLSFWYLVPLYGLNGIYVGLLLNYIIYSGSSFVYIQLKYKYVSFPMVYMLKVLVSLFGSVLLGYIASNEIMSSIISMLTFVILFYITLKLDDNDIYILKKLRIERVEKYLPRKFRLKE
jgi:O-antigen/teichoic acid export membrane protein